MLSVTVIGAIIGVPLIIFAIYLAFSLPQGLGLTGVTGRNARCPYCSAGVFLQDGSDRGVDCSTCKQRIVVRNGKLYRLADL
jgi:hypothetical protein